VKGEGRKGRKRKRGVGENQGCAGLLLAPDKDVEPTSFLLYLAARQENHRDTATADFAVQPLHDLRRQLMYIEEKYTSFFLNRKLKKSERNRLRKLRSKSTSWGRNMRAAASPLVRGVGVGPPSGQIEQGKAAGSGSLSLLVRPGLTPVSLLRSERQVCTLKSKSDFPALLGRSSRGRTRVIPGS
jgi:hypothetical protein